MSSEQPGGIAVYCGSSQGKRQAYANAALSLGRTLAEQNRPLIYGGGTRGLMGIVASAVLEGGGDVTGVVPFAMYAGGGEGEKVSEPQPMNESSGTLKGGKIETIIVDSMHERKVEMASRSIGFVGLPGGFGTYEEIMEVTTWTQLGIHNKPVVLLNVLSYFDPLRQLIQNGVTEGYINPSNQRIIIFVDGPALHEEHDSFDWGKAGLEAIKAWERKAKPLFDWEKRKDGTISERRNLAAT